eukprot:Ihof_evm19s1 gene=Ihof_evmTU19s1
MSTKDRTAEFHSVAQVMRKRKGNVPINSNKRRGANIESQCSDFKRLAGAVQKDINNTFTKLEKLNLLIQKRSLFENRTAEIESLTGIIRQDIANLNQHIARLQKYNRAQNMRSRQSETHANNIVIALQSRLASLSSGFKEALEMRQKALQEQSLRSQQQSPVPASSNPPVVHDNIQPPAPQYGTPPPPYMHTGPKQQGPMGGRYPAGGAYMQAELTQRHRPSNSVNQATSIDMGGTDYMQAQLNEPKTTYNQDRMRGVDQINKTIAELGSIFTQLATMVHEQGQAIE